MCSCIIFWGKMGGGYGYMYVKDVFIRDLYCYFFDLLYDVK